MNRILITAGIHGDEIGAILTAKELKGWVEGKGFRNVEIIHDANKKGIEARVRENPSDDKDLNRLFPGDKNGTDSDIIVNELFEKAKKFDYIIDLHTYGKGSRCLPYMLTDLKRDFNKKFCKKIGLDYAVQTAGTSGQMFIELSNRGIPAMIIEAGGAEWLEDAIYEKVKNCIKDFILNIEHDRNVRFFDNYDRIEFDDEGYFKPLTSLGDEVEKSEIIGYVDGMEIVSPCKGLILGIKSEGEFDPDEETLAAIAEY